MWLYNVIDRYFVVSFNILGWFSVHSYLLITCYFKIFIFMYFLKYLHMLLQVSGFKISRTSIFKHEITRRILLFFSVIRSNIISFTAEKRVVLNFVNISQRHFQHCLLISVRTSSSNKPSSQDLHSNLN